MKNPQGKNKKQTDAVLCVFWDLACKPKAEKGAGNQDIVNVHGLNLLN